MKLYYYPLNASMAPRFVLEAIGVSHELVLVDRKTNSQKSPEYLALNPTGRIPVLVADESVIFESAAICIYLCERNPETGLIPNTAAKRAIFFQWLMFLTTTVQSELMIYFYPEKHTGDQSLSRQIRQVQDARIVQMFSLLDRELTGKDFLLGDEISLCDYFLFMLSVWADELSSPPLTFKNLNPYLRKLAARPEIAQVCRHENLDLTPYA